MTLTKENLVALLAEHSSFNKKECALFLKIILEELQTNLVKAKIIKISGFGKWEVKHKKNRTVYHPSTGEIIHLSSRNIVTFLPSEKLRNKLKQKTN